MAYNPVLPAGQATMANSAPVVVASNQTDLPVNGSVAVTNFPATQNIAVSGTPVFTGSVSVSNFPATQPVSIAAAWGGTGSTYVVNGAGSFATQGVAVSGIPTVIPSGNNYIGTVSGAFSATIDSAYIPSGNFYGMASGTTSWRPLMVESGTTTTPGRLVTVTNVWSGTGSVYLVNGTPGGGAGSVSLYDLSGVQAYFDNGRFAGSIVTMPSVLGSVAVTNTITTQPLIGSVYGIGAGSIAAAIISPATIGSLATQGVIGSVAVSNFPATQAVSLAAPWTGTGSVYVTAGSVTATINTMPIGSIYGIGIGSVFSQVLGSVAVTNTITANPATSYGKTIVQYALDQGAAGTTQIAAASASNNHKVLGVVITMTLSGTVQFTDGTANLTGPMFVAERGGFVLPTSMLPYFQTAATNRPLNIVTTNGAADGVIIYTTEP